jgi:hypothetical protein
MDPLTSRLKALAHPALPRDLTAGVLARVETIGQPRPAPVSIAPSPALWATASGSIVAAAGIAVSVASGDLPLLHVTPFSAWRLATTAGAVPLLVGLGLYLIGVFIPFGERRPYA